MALKIRLRQQGRTNRPFYRVVLTDCRSPRDGKYLEALGWYNPVETEEERVLSLNGERIQHWLGLGAQMTDNVEVLVCKSIPAIAKYKREKTLAALAKAKAQREKRKKNKAQAVA